MARVDMAFSAVLYLVRYEARTAIRRLWRIPQPPSMPRKAATVGHVGRVGRQRMGTRDKCFKALQIVVRLTRTEGLRMLFVACYWTCAWDVCLRNCLSQRPDGTGLDRESQCTRSNLLGRHDRDRVWTPNVFRSQVEPVPGLCQKGTVCAPEPWHSKGTGLLKLHVHTSVNSGGY